MNTSRDSHLWVKDLLPRLGSIGERLVKNSANPQSSYVGFRVSNVLKARLEKAAEASGRSLSDEVRIRLEASFRNEVTR